MTLDFLLRAFGWALSKREPTSHRDSEDQNEPDDENPFPEVVAIEFSDVLDLHSIPPRQIRAVVEDYLEEAHRRRIRWLRIIHGKGVGVQREIVRSMLARSLAVCRRVQRCAVRSRRLGRNSGNASGSEIRMTELCDSQLAR